MLCWRPCLFPPGGMNHGNHRRKVAALRWPRGRRLRRGRHSVATVAGAARPPRGKNAYVVAVSRAVRRYPKHNVRGVLEGPGRATTAVQRRGVG